jgi:hypothetical protein
VTGTSYRSGSSKLKQRIARMLATGTLLAIAADSALFAVDFRSSRSSYEAFRHLRLAMPQSEVDVILGKYHVACLASVSGMSAPGQCEFSDRWRAYTLVYDRPDGRVVEMRYYFKARRGVLARLCVRNYD